jgi:hypothetical protein
MRNWLKMSPSTFVLTRGELTTLRPGGRTCRISCVAGRLWVTTGGRREDSVLVPGEGIAVTGRGTVIVQALRTATVRLEVDVPARSGSRAAFPLPRPLVP